MLEQALLRQRFQDLLAKERHAAEAYAELLAQSEDPKIRDELDRLIRDKQRHIQLAERLLEIVD